MKKSIMKTNPLLKIFNNSLVILPTPINISIWWNFGSLIGLYLLVQIISGLILSMHYCPSANSAFESIIHIMKDVNYGNKMRKIHMNGASMFFICMYMHIARGIYYRSYKLVMTWSIGVLIMLMSMAAAFMGYILPWGQMSYWGATVITNLMSAIPIFGNSIVQWLWGGFSVDGPTLNRFYSFHFIIPFMIMGLVVIHLMYLHQTGSNNPTGMNSNIYKVPFHPYFSFKDILGMLMMSMLMILTMKIFPALLKDHDNFIQANPMITPTHIQPEWYFLFAYAILRSIPSKLGGVIALVSSIMILLILPLTKSKFSSTTFYPLSKSLFWIFASSVIMLTWLGAQPIEYPFMTLSQIYSTLYFGFFFLMNYTNNSEDKIIDSIFPTQTSNINII